MVQRSCRQTNSSPHALLNSISGRYIPTIWEAQCTELDPLSAAQTEVQLLLQEAVTLVDSRESLGLDHHFPPSQETLVHLIVNSDRPNPSLGELLKFSHCHRIDVDSPDNTGRTASHVATGRGNDIRTQLLPAAGASPNKADQPENTPLNSAMRSFPTHGAVIRLVQAASAAGCCNRRGETPLIILFVSIKEQIDSSDGLDRGQDVFLRLRRLYSLLSQTSKASFSDRGASTLLYCGVIP